MNLAAKMDMLPLTSSQMGYDGVRAQFGSLVHARAANGKSIDDLSLGLQCITHVAPTDEEAFEALKYARWQNRAQRGLNRHDVVNGQVNATPYEGELDDEEFMDRLFFGSPETVIEKFKKFSDVGATHISNWMMFGGIEHEKMMRSIRLMGEEVLPALRDVHPPADLPSKLLEEQPLTNEELQNADAARAPRDMAT